MTSYPVASLRTKTYFGQPKITYCSGGEKRRPEIGVRSLPIGRLAKLVRAQKALHRYHGGGDFE